MIDGDVEDKNMMTNTIEFGISIQAAAKALGISRSLAYQLARTGDLPTIRLGARRLIVPIERLKDRLEADPPVIRRHQP